MFNRQNLIEMNVARKKPAALALEKGQVWQLPDGLIMIVALGKNLTHYKRLRTVGQKGVPTKLERTSTVADYLKANKATLITQKQAA